MKAFSNMLTQVITLVFILYCFYVCTYDSFQLEQWHVLVIATTSGELLVWFLLTVLLEY